MTWVLWNIISDIGSEIVLDKIMVLLRDEAQVDACFILFGDSAKLDARYVYGLCRTYHRLRNHSGCTRWNAKVTWVMWKHVSIRLEIVLVSVQVRCTVCAKRTIGTTFVLDVPDGTPS